MPWRSNSEPTQTEKIVAGLSYLTFGVAGLLYILLFNKGGSQSQIFRFHFFQSILLWIVATLLGYAAQPVLGILLGIIGLASADAAHGIASAVMLAMKGLSLAFFALCAYGAVMAFLGRFAEVPVISRVVRQNMRS